METILIKEIKFLPNGNTLWVTSQNDKVLITIRTAGKIVITDLECQNLVCHADMTTPNAIVFRDQVQNSSRSPKKAAMVTIPAGAVEFSPGGSTVWIQSPIGATILRIRSMSGYVRGKPITVIGSNIFDHKDEGNFHADISIPGDIEICLVKEVSAQLERLVDNN